VLRVGGHVLFSQDQSEIVLKTGPKIHGEEILNRMTTTTTTTTTTDDDV